MQDFLPVTREDMKSRGWDELDFVYVTGDAYVDHPSFGSAIIGRLLESRGYRVGMIPQPDWRKKESIQVFGEPRLGFLVTAGNMDSMVNHYTVSKKHRSTDAYSPGGKMGLRPDRASVVYSNLIRQTYKHTPIILGGIEASLRRMAHYDYWENKVKHSILIDSGADLISYGMGEHSILEIAEALQSGIPVQEITYVAGTVFKSHDISRVYDPVVLPSFEQVQTDKKSLRGQLCHSVPKHGSIYSKASGRILWEPWICDTESTISAPDTDGNGRCLRSALYRTISSHVPERRRDSGTERDQIQSDQQQRMLWKAVNFCALTFHQGRILQTRSHDSILKEAEKMTEDPDFKGYIHDVGGPTADFRYPSCKKQLTKGVCKERQCLFPSPCKNLTVDHKDYLQLLRKVRNIPKVKKVFVRSGIRFDYLMADPDKTFLNELVKYHVSGQLRVAPEHVSDEVLKFMGKPRHEVYEGFLKEYEKANARTGKQQYAVPYFMSSHPGCTMKEAVKLAEYVRDLGFTPEQVQDFYPTPSTLSTCMYYTGIHPLTGEKVYVPKNPHEKAIQRALMQYKIRKIANWSWKDLR